MGESELTIRQLGPKGDGIHEGPKGRVYAERTVPGDRVRARVRRDAEGLMRAEVIDLLEPSPHRAPAPCPHFDRCGNCTLQHVKEDFYRSWKIHTVKEALDRYGIAPKEWLEPIFVGGANRRRATFSAKKERGKVSLGYYRRRSQEIIDIDSCLVADPVLLGLRERLKPFLQKALTEGQALDVFVQLVGGAADVVLTGPLSTAGKQKAKELLEIAPIRRIGARRREGERIESLGEAGPIVASFGLLKVALPPAAFLQPTAQGEKALAESVLSALPREGKFADLFSGCGTFTGPMLTRGPVDAYESAVPSVGALTRAAAGLPLRVFRRDLFRNPLRREELNRFDAIVFDPPRAGCREQAEAMARARVPVLVGVSCNPATFARDASVLCRGGYRLQSVRVVDQFLWSHHAEVIGVFRRSSRR
jgi:23S rRNA (uracil1939-C5)-methyltransferase